MNACCILKRQLVEMIVVEYHAVCPCPLVFAVVVVYITEPLHYRVDIRQRAVLYLVHKSLLLRCWQQQSREVVPVAKPHIRSRRVKLWVSLKHPLEHGPHIYAQGYVVVFYALAQGRGVDDILMVIVCRDIVSRGLPQILKDGLALQYLSHGEWRQPVEVDNTLLRACGAHVPLGPFSYVSV